MEKQDKVLEQLAREWQDLMEREMQLIRRLNDESNEDCLDILNRCIKTAE